MGWGGVEDSKIDRVINNSNQTFTVELDNMERMLIQMELTVIAGDHESYKISANTNGQRELLSASAITIYKHHL